MAQVVDQSAMIPHQIIVVRLLDMQRFDYAQQISLSTTLCELRDSGQQM